MTTHLLFRFRRSLVSNALPAGTVVLDVGTLSAEREEGLERLHVVCDLDGFAALLGGLHNGKAAALGVLGSVLERVGVLRVTLYSN